MRKQGEKFGSKYEWYWQIYRDKKGNKQGRRVLREKESNEFSRKRKPSYDGEWEWYWDEYIDSKG